MRPHNPGFILFVLFISLRFLFGFSLVFLCSISLEEVRMLVVYSSPVTDIATEQGADGDDDADPVMMMIRAEESAEQDYAQLDSTLSQSEYVQSHRHFYL